MESSDLRELPARNLQILGQALSQVRVEEDPLVIDGQRQQALAHDGDDPPLVDQLEELIPEAGSLGARGSWSSGVRRCERGRASKVPR